MSAEGAATPRVVLKASHSAVDDLLREIQYLLLEHPIAAQAAFAALVAEGRRFAETDEGRALKERLDGSPLMGRMRIVWDTTTLEQLSESSSRALPTAFVDAIVTMASHPDLEPLLTRLFQGARSS